MKLSNHGVRNSLPPTPEEFQRRLQEMMRSQFGSASGPSGAQVAPGTEGSNPDDTTASEASSHFEFDLKPRDVKAHLDRYVIRQEEAKKVLSVALCAPYNAVKSAQQGDDAAQYVKQNFLLLGAQRVLVTPSRDRRSGRRPRDPGWSDWQREGRCGTIGLRWVPPPRSSSCADA